MKKISLFIAILILSSCQNQAQNNNKAMEIQKPVQSQTIYQFKVTDLYGKELTVEVINIDKSNIILYRANNILYQRWNNIVMNYNYGTFDLFINNNLVSTNPGIVTEIKPDDLLEVGFKTNNDLGGITKMLYSDEPLRLDEIQKIYLDKPKI